MDTGSGGPFGRGKHQGDGLRAPGFRGFRVRQAAPDIYQFATIPVKCAGRTDFPVAGEILRKSLGTSLGLFSYGFLVVYFFVKD